MALTDVITQELLAAFDTGTDPQPILARYSGSKGPLYAALARATAAATTRLQTVMADAQAAEARRTAAEQAQAAATRDTAAARRSLQAVTRQHTALTQTLEAQHARLAVLQALQDAGWEGESLAALAHVFHATDPARRPAWRAFVQVAQAARDTQDLAARVQAEAERVRRAEAAVATRRTDAHVTAAAVTLARWWVDHQLTAPWVRSICQQQSLFPQIATAHFPRSAGDISPKRHRAFPQISTRGILERQTPRPGQGAGSRGAAGARSRGPDDPGPRPLRVFGRPTGAADQARSSEGATGPVPGGLSLGTGEAGAAAAPPPAAQASSTARAVWCCRRSAPWTRSCSARSRNVMLSCGWVARYHSWRSAPGLWRRRLMTHPPGAGRPRSRPASCPSTDTTPPECSGASHDGAGGPRWPSPAPDRHTLRPIRCSPCSR